MKNFFLPSFFIVLYYLINQSLGSFLAPLNYGFSSWFAPDLIAIKNYNIIVPYFLVSNVVLFVISLYSLRLLNTKPSLNFPKELKTRNISPFLVFIGFSILTIILVLLSVLEVFSVYSYQLIIIIIILSYVSYQKIKFRYLIYLLYLAIMVTFNFENKREVIVALFVVFFLEAYHQRWLIQFTLSKIIAYFIGVSLFFVLIFTTSILRGYGEYGAKTLFSAASYIPDYITSDIFADGLTDNLELNYSYSTAVTSMDMVIKGDIKYQYGLTILKIFFLPIPRDIFPDKPGSIMQIYTQKYQPGFWDDGGSLPVILPADMFANFNIFGIIPFILICLCLDVFFMRFHLATSRGFKYFTNIFLFITILFLARGSGLELYFLFYIFAFPFLIIYTVASIILLGRIRKNLSINNKIDK